jgi:hypothetical protein
MMRQGQLPYQLSLAEQDVLDERRGQRTREGFFNAHDDQHIGFELSMAAECYLRGGVIAGRNPNIPPSAIDQGGGWPWIKRWWKPASARRMLVKAAALILAEIERLDRAEANKADGGGA